MSIRPDQRHMLGKNVGDRRILDGFQNHYGQR